MVLGKSGSGKSTSLRNFAPGEVGVLNVLGKPLPFRGSLPTWDLVNYRRCEDAIASGKRRAWVIDDAGYLMSNENFSRAKEGGYEKFTDMSIHFFNLIQAALRAPDGTITYFLMHPDTNGDACGHEKVRTVGKMLDEKFCVEGAFPVVIDCEVRDGRHVFVTENDGTNLAKSPMGMLPEVMDNDLREVDRLIREYWGMPPLAIDAPAGAGGEA